VVARATRLAGCQQHPAADLVEQLERTLLAIDDPGCADLLA
jgi:hypothetical protein